tara:strand:+ start:63 stop:266 length:204 start_codon:yes stop_codon:yes gene_type:complete
MGIVTENIMGCLIRGFNRPYPIETLREKTWVDELLEQYPNCPNPITYPKAAYFYLKTRLYFKQFKDA